MGKKSGSGFGMSHPDHISESLKKTIFWVKILALLDADPGWKNFGSGIRDEKSSDPRHCSIVESPVQQAHS
jgi:hypothetical protein